MRQVSYLKTPRTSSLISYRFHRENESYIKKSRYRHCLKDETNLYTNITKEEGIYTICKAYLNSYCKRHLEILEENLTHSD